MLIILRYQCKYQFHLFSICCFVSVSVCIRIECNYREIEYLPKAHFSKCGIKKSSRCINARLSSFQTFCCLFQFVELGVYICTELGSNLKWKMWIFETDVNKKGVAVYKHNELLSIYVYICSTHHHYSSNGGTYYAISPPGMLLPSIFYEIWVS